MDKGSYLESVVGQQGGILYMVVLVLVYYVSPDHS